MTLVIPLLFLYPVQWFLIPQEILYRIIDIISKIFALSSNKFWLDNFFFTVCSVVCQSQLEKNNLQKINTYNDILNVLIA